jgi:hypothetical protein
MIKRSREYIMNWLLIWLSPCPVHSITMFQVNETVYELCFHFRIAFTNYGIYKDHTTSEMIWFSFENDYFSDHEFLIAPRFNSYKNLIQYVTDEFYKKWNSDLVSA